MNTRIFILDTYSVKGDHMDTSMKWGKHKSLTCHLKSMWGALTTRNARSKVAALTAIVILVEILSLYSVYSLWTTSYKIPSSGSFPSIETQPRGAYTNEMRALFVHAMSFINPDWESITQTARDNKIDVLVIEIMGNNYARYPSAYIPSFSQDELAPAIAAAHARGIKLYISMNVLLSAPSDKYKVMGADGVLRDTLDPTNPDSKILLKNLVEEVTGKYEIDGFMFDYVRYDSADVPYGQYARQSLEQFLEETITNWPGDFAPGGSRHNEFMEWRVHPINDLVGDMHSWMLAIKPDLEISAAVWGWEPNWPTQNRYWIGQDSAYWIQQGWLDWVAPMIYTTDLNRLASMIQGYHADMTAGPEGKIPLIPFLSDAFPSTVDPANFKAQIDTVRANGADGWIIWRYGGPGDGQGSGAPDIRQYLSIVDFPNVFSISNVTASQSTNSATITWTTDLPCISKVEYSTSPLFTSSFVHDARVDFSYWDINHAVGAIVENAAAVTNHSVTLTSLVSGTTYYYRVQSQDQSSIVTSAVYTFKL